MMRVMMQRKQLFCSSVRFALFWYQKKENGAFITPINKDLIQLPEADDMKSFENRKPFPSLPHIQGLVSFHTRIFSCSHVISSP